MTEQMPSVHDLLMKADTPRAQHSAAPQPDDDKAPSKTFKRIAIFSLCAVALIGVGFAVPQLALLLNAAERGDAKTARQSTGQTNTTQAINNPFKKHAEEAGISACTAVYSALGQALTNGTDYMVQTQTATADADRHSLYGAVGMAFRSEVEGGYKGNAAGIVFASPVPSGCEGTMVRIVPFVQNCEAAKAFLPQGSKTLQPLAGLSLYGLGTGGQAILMPNNQGCIAISVVRAGAPT